MYNWSITQGLNFSSQLTAGIRYFDLRIAVNPNDGMLYLVHGLYSLTLENCLKEINLFLNNHPKEVVLLDFNHFYEFTESVHENCLAMIMDIFGNKLCPLLDPSTTNLSILNENGLQVIVFYHCPEVCSCHMEVWPGDLIPSPWADTTNVDKLQHFLESNYEKYCHRGPDKFIVSQCILTPDVGYIVCHLCDSLKNKLALPSNQSLVNWLQSKKAGPGGINICIIDFVEYCNYASIVVSLNR